MEKSNVWWYQGKELTPDMVPEWAVAFIYRIVRTGNREQHPKIYIGKKMLTSTRKKKIGIRAQQKQKKETGDGRVKKVAKITKSSNWESYWSSCEEIKAGVLVYPQRFNREIIEFCFSKKNATYLEMKYQFMYKVLENDTFNSNINGSLYKHDTDRQLYEEFLQRNRKPIPERKPEARESYKPKTDDK